jgi:hypothetical protein
MVGTLSSVVVFFPAASWASFRGSVPHRANEALDQYNPPPWAQARISANAVNAGKAPPVFNSSDPTRTYVPPKEPAADGATDANGVKLPSPKSVAQIDAANAAAPAPDTRDESSTTVGSSDSAETRIAPSPARQTAERPPPHGDPNAGRPEADPTVALARYRAANPAAYGPTHHGSPALTAVPQSAAEAVRQAPPAVDRATDAGLRRVGSGARSVPAATAAASDAVEISGTSASSFVSKTFSPESLFDGNKKVGWIAKSPEDEWVQIDLQTPVHVSALKLFFEEDYGPNGFSVELRLLPSRASWHAAASGELAGGFGCRPFAWCRVPLTGAPLANSIRFRVRNTISWTATQARIREMKIEECSGCRSLPSSGRAGPPLTDTAPSTEDDEGDDEFLGKVRSAYEQDVEAVKTCIKGVVARVGTPHAPSRGRRLAAGLPAGSERSSEAFMRQCEACCRSPEYTDMTSERCEALCAMSTTGMVAHGPDSSEGGAAAGSDPAAGAGGEHGEDPWAAAGGDQSRTRLSTRTPSLRAVQKAAVAAAARLEAAERAEAWAQRRAKEEDARTHALARAAPRGDGVGGTKGGSEGADDDGVAVPWAQASLGGGRGISERQRSMDRGGASGDPARPGAGAVQESRASLMQSYRAKKAAEEARRVGGGYYSRRGRAEAAKERYASEQRSYAQRTSTSGEGQHRPPAAGVSSSMYASYLRHYAESHGGRKPGAGRAQEAPSWAGRDEAARSAARWTQVHREGGNAAPADSFAEAWSRVHARDRNEGHVRPGM